MLHEQLGEGGYGSVHRATHPLLGEVALKLLHSRGGSAIRGFVREGTLVLDHPAIPRILDHGEIDGQWFLALELVGGRSVASLLGEEGRLPEARAIAVARGVAEALAYAHARGLVHCDVKPQNVIVDGERVVVLDFGIARIRDLPEPERRGAAPGTPAFMAPEQARGEEVGPPADLWALGVLLYAMLAGRLPFDAVTPYELMSATLHQEPLPLADRAPGSSPALVALVERLLAKRAELRPGAAEAARILATLALAAGPAARDPIERARGGHGGLLLVTGADRRAVRERLEQRAGSEGFKVEATVALATDGPYDALGRVAGGMPALPERPTSRQLADAWSQRLRALAAPGPALLSVADAHRIDDGSRELLVALAPVVAAERLLLLLDAPDADQLSQGWLASLAASGALATLPGPRVEPAPGEEPAAIPEDVLFRQGVDAERLRAPELARLRLSRLLESEGLSWERRLRALALLGAVERRNPTRALEIFVEALAIAREHGTEIDQARALRELGIAQLSLGSLDAGTASLRESSRIAVRCGDVRLEAVNLNSLAVAAWQALDIAGAATLCEEAIVRFRAAGLHADAGPSLSNLGIMYLQLGRLPESRARQEEALAIAREEGDTSDESRCLLNLGNVLGALGLRAACREALEASLAIRRRVGSPAEVGKVLGNLFLMMLQDGEQETALPVARELEALVRRSGIPAEIARCLEYRALLARQMHQPDEARRHALEAREWSRRAQSLGGEASSLRQLAAVARDDAEAMALLEEAAALVARLGDRAIELVIECDLAARIARTGDCRRLEALLVEAEAQGATTVVVDARMHLARALAAGDRARATELAERAAGMARELGLREQLVEALRLWEELRSGAA